MDGTLNILRYDYEFLFDVSGGCIVADPLRRLTVNEVLDRVSAVNESMGYDMRAPLTLAAKPSVPEAAPARPPAPSPVPASSPAPHRPPPPAPARPAPPRFVSPRSDILVKSLN